jgi:hypothetical protein
MGRKRDQGLGAVDRKGKWRAVDIHSEVDESNIMPGKRQRRAKE